jgi:hypothetical protein
MVDLEDEGPAIGVGAEDDQGQRRQQDGGDAQQWSFAICQEVPWPPPGRAISSHRRWSGSQTSMESLKEKGITFFGVAGSSTPHPGQRRAFIYHLVWLPAPFPWIALVDTSFFQPFRQRR